MILALQYWSGDEAKAMRLARFIADIEPKRRTDCMLALVRRFDCPITPDAEATWVYCGAKMPAVMARSEREGKGWPGGCNNLWIGTMERMVHLAAIGFLPHTAVFTFEADCVPISQDWIGRLVDAHGESLRQGKRVTGALQDKPCSHFNGNLIIEVSAFIDHPSFTACPCPDSNAWDCWHAPVLLREGRGTSAILNVYNGRDMSEAMLVTHAREVALVHGIKDDSAYEAARNMLLPEGKR